LKLNSAQFKFAFNSPILLDASNLFSGCNRTHCTRIVGTDKRLSADKSCTVTFRHRRAIIESRSAVVDDPDITPSIDNIREYIAAMMLIGATIG